jgi:hypothetical protein
MKVPKSAQTPAEVRVEQLKRLGCTRYPSNFRIFDLRHAIVSRPNFTEGMSVKGVKPGELYVVGLSMKRTGPGYAFLDVRFRGKGEEVKSKEPVPSIVMPGPRKEGVWDAGEVVLRIPEGADELYYSLSFELFDDHSTVAVDRFKVYKIGEPLPVWPAETVREKERRK